MIRSSPVNLRSSWQKKSPPQGDAFRAGRILAGIWTGVNSFMQGQLTHLSQIACDIIIRTKRYHPMFGLSPPSYTKSHTFVAGLRDMTIQVISKPGLPHWNEITPTTALLSEHIQLRSIDKVLLLGCRHGALGVVLARLAGAGELWLMDTSFIALECSRQTLEKNGISPVHLHPVITLLPDQAEQFDCVAMENPKGRKLARRWLIEA